MSSYEVRSAFFFGITLNELSFIMFFLLMFISTTSLQTTNNKLEKEIKKKTDLQNEIKKIKSEQDESFKRLQLLENRLMKAGGFAVSPNEQQLNEMFSKLQVAKVAVELIQSNKRLQQKLQSLEHFKRLSETYEQSGLSDKLPKTIDQLLTQTKKFKKQQLLLKERMAYVNKQLQGNGLDHPPCWANPSNGAIEYLYSITLYQNGMQFEAAWPEHRKADLDLMPGAEKLAGQHLTLGQLAQHLNPISDWSKHHDCRHFVRIKDHKHTSKQSYKQQLKGIESYFYKYLER